jgi:hypothetical protein
MPLQVSLLKPTGHAGSGAGGSYTPVDEMQEVEEEIQDVKAQIRQLPADSNVRIQLLGHLAQLEGQMVGGWVGGWVRGL